MLLNPAKVAFGRHESFALRFGWLTKGFHAFEKRPDIFTDDDAVVELGVGRNMVNSIKHWLRAAKIIEITPDSKETTELGRKIFSEDSGWDPYLEDEATIWLIHWLLATNPEHATSWYWFFNRFHKPEFTAQEMTTALADFTKETITAKASINTVKQDGNALLRTYVQSKGNQKIPAEESLDSPLSLLKLITYSPANKSYQSRLDRRDSLPLGIFGYAIANLFEHLEISEMPIEDLMYSRDGQPAPGLIFRLTENDLLTKLEQLVSYIPGVFKISDTAGVHQLFQLNPIPPLEYLRMHYSDYFPEIQQEAV